MYTVISQFFVFFETAPSFEAWQTHWYLKNRLGIVRAQGGFFLDHPYAPLFVFLCYFISTDTSLFFVLIFRSLSSFFSSDHLATDTLLLVP